LWDAHEFWSYRLFCFSSSAGQSDLTPVNANTDTEYVTFLEVVGFIVDFEMKDIPKRWHGQRNLPPEATDLA
jgi:hypothetical protein